MIYSFRPLKSEAKIKTILAFDVEGVGGPDGFVCGSIAGAYTAEFYTDRQAMWESLLAHGAQGEWIFAHNLEYDLPIVAGEELFNGELIFKPRGILKGTWRHWGRPVRYFDSLGLFPRWSVEDLGELTGRPKLAEGSGVVDRISAGARYADLSAAEQRLVYQYCQRDAEIVYQAVELLQQTLLSLGGELKPTIAGCSMDLFRRRYMKFPWRTLGPETNRLARPAFYGGRTENYALGAVEGVSLYDLNSLYPAVQSEAAFPHPSHLTLYQSPRVSYVLDRLQGVAHAEVHVPESYVPVLPDRIQERLFFPTGDLEGSWTISELKAAVDRGAEIRRLDWALATDVLFNPFRDFIDHLYRLRRRDLAEGQSRQLVLKLILNSLYGRFGLDPEGGLWQMVALPDKPDWQEFRGWTTSEIGGQVVAYGPLAGLQPPAYVNVPFAAEIAAQGRLALLAGLEGQGEDLIYCDTDSVMTRGALETGEGLGEWKLQMEDGTADLLGPKEYVLHNLAFGDRYVVKGIPDGLAESWIETGTARFRRALRIREAIYRGRNPSEWVEVTRSHRPTIPKRQPALPPWEERSAFLLTLPWARPALLELVGSRAERRAADLPAPSGRDPLEWALRAAADLGLDPELGQTAATL